MTYIHKLQENWESLAQKDPLWAVCTDPSQKNGKWDINAFFKTGEEEVTVVLEYLKKASLTPDHSSPLLDFGCGVGRLTQAFSRSFEKCTGVDISATMIAHAQKYNRDPARCSFRVNEREDLKLFTDSYFGFIYTSLVLQHMRPALSARYLGEFCRVLKPNGIAVVQIVDHDNLSAFQRFKQTLRPRTRARGFIEVVLRKQKKREPVIPMYCLAEKKVRALVGKHHVTVAAVAFTNSADKDFNGKLRYVSAPAAEGYVSKQYVLVKK